MSDHASTDQKWDRLLQGARLDSRSATSESATAESASAEPGSREPATSGSGSSGRSAPSRSRRKAAASAGEGKRRDIQGLRAVAVVTVVINHLTGYPRGGFVGVDVFFVISGFLITGHLVRDLGRTNDGRAQSFAGYLGGFYRRRIRRLFPAALVVLVLTTLASQTIFSATRFTSTWHDGIYAALFVANWHFYAQGTNYFTAGLPDSPFQHYWSLSVEEQFYLAWPIVLFLLGAALMARSPDAIGRRRLAGAVAAGALCVGSLGWAYWESDAHPISAYFSTWSRGWELGLGALLACVVPYVRPSVRVMTGMSWVGVIAIGVSLFLARGGHGFPVPGAILPCVGACLVIAATAPGRTVRNPVLTNPGSVFLGDISYSLYLVHFPVIILLAAWMNQRGAYFYTAAGFVALGISVALYALVEQPVLNSRWLLPRRARQAHERADGPPTAQVAVVAAAITVTGMVAVALWPGEQAASEAKLATIDAALRSHARSASGVAAATPEAQKITDAITSALRASSWPRLSPSIDEVSGGSLVPGRLRVCGGTSVSPASECTFGHRDGRHTLELVGDSNAMAWAPALKKMVAAVPGWKLRIAAGFGCEFSSTVVLGNDEQGVLASHCRSRNDQVVADVKAVRPDLLVMTNISTFDTQVRSDEDELAKVASYAHRVVVLAAPPHSIDPHACFTKTSSPTDCVATLPGTYAAATKRNAEIAAKFGGVSIDVTDWFCAADLCPAFAGTTPTRYDAGHVSTAYALKLEPAMLERFRVLDLLG